MDADTGAGFMREEQEGIAAGGDTEGKSQEVLQESGREVFSSPIGAVSNS